MLNHLWILLCLVSYGCSKNYFCDLHCGKKHTACKREPCGPSHRCGSNYEMLEMDDKSRQWVLDFHNDVRNNIAKGNVTRGGNGNASNMNALSYSKEIEFVAQCLANACGSQGAHDTCRSTSKFRSVGQNMYAVGGAGTWKFTEKKWLVEGMNYWYSEITDMREKFIDKFQSTQKTIGHFTQLVWAKTTYIGCGRTQYGSGRGHSMLLYCNYAVGGNVLGEPVYLRGQPCSECDSGGCNSKYKALCGKIRSLNDDKWDPPFKLAGSRLQGSINKLILIIVCMVI